MIVFIFKYYEGKKIISIEIPALTIREAWDKFWENRKWVFVNEINETTR